MSFTWTDELKKQAIADYEAATPTPENSMEVVKELAEGLGCTANGLRSILTRADVYIKKAPVKSGTTSASSSTKRVSKADALKALHTAIEASGREPDDEITSKLTGKAALYFADLLTPPPEEE